MNYITSHPVLLTIWVFIQQHTIATIVVLIWLSWIAAMFWLVYNAPELPWHE